MTTFTAPTSKKIRILIADDHPLIRQGLTAILTQEIDMDVVGQARDGDEACMLYDQLSPDILVLDLRMPKVDGLGVIHELASRIPRPSIIVLTTSERTEDLRRALTEGARGYLLKGAEAVQVCQTIREVFAGKSSLPPEVAAKLADSMAYPQLSQRELEVLEHMALGKSNKEIGHHLYLSEHTVKNYVKVILRKLNAASRTEATATAVERGLVNMG
jgi:DNA-binding NarL/FixJ family response regulator